MKIRGFRDLKIWRLGKEIVLDIYEKSRDFPREELYGLVSQMRRCAVSIPSNIAEGFSRTYKNDYKRFLNIALGSCAELETQTEIACDLKYLSNVDKCRILDKINYESRMIKNLISKIEQTNC